MSKTLYVKSLIGEGTAIVSSNADTITINVPPVSLYDANPDSGTSIITNGIGPNLLLKSLQGAGTTVVYPDPNENVIYIESHSSDIRIRAEYDDLYGINLVYNAIGPNLSLKTLRSTTDTVIVYDDGWGDVEVYVPIYGILATVNPYTIPSDQWYYLSLNVDTFQFLPKSGGPSPSYNVSIPQPYINTTAGLSAPDWSTDLQDAAIIDGSSANILGNDEVSIRLTFSVPSDFQPSFDSSHFITLAVFNLDDDGVTTHIADYRQFRFSTGGSNLFMDQPPNNFVSNISLISKLFAKRYVVGVYHNLSTNISFLENPVSLNPSPPYGIRYNGPIFGSAILFQKFFTQAPIIP